MDHRQVSGLKERGIVEMLTWDDGTVMARWRPDVGDHQTIAAHVDPKVVNQEIYKWIAAMERDGWHKAGSTGAITYLERRPPKRHSDT